MKFRNKNILCFGELLWDRLPSGSKPGGAPMNVALHLKRFGLSPWFASRVGDDEAGEGLITFLKEHKIQTGLVQRGKTLPTSEVIVTINEKGEPSYQICEPVAWDNIAWTSKLAQKSHEAGIIVFGTLAARNHITRQTLLNILNNRAYRVLDVNLRPPFVRQDIVELLLSKSDFVKLSIDELSTIAGWLEIPWYKEEQGIRKFADHFGLSGVCVTRGADGAVLYVRGHYYEHSGFKVDVADTVGAGDAFLAALIWSFVNHKTPDEALAFACATGALVASKSGASPAYSPNEIYEIMNAG